ncbi:hypothetical protein [Salimicrobium flavidum]|uniref:DUF3221 domain-containing protein n=1 Tax=Salimicrobium flavidum TaxID=570947 RepID=A0A1N7J2M5_9BACI|nr:hypothetical protein [Salimicrobium flavidum]SIS43559.1 hypothetical protein SAMN05421687_103251 [Salimicrobium flavidum]
MKLLGSLLLLLLIIPVLVSGCGFTSDEPEVEYIQKTGVVKERSESNTRILVESEKKEELYWFIISEEEFRAIETGDNVIVTYNRYQAWMTQDPPSEELKV